MHASDCGGEFRYGERWVGYIFQFWVFWGFFVVVLVWFCFVFSPVSAWEGWGGGCSLLSNSIRNQA